MTELKDVWYWYEYGQTVIRDASAAVGEGRIYGLLGKLEMDVKEND